VNRELPPCHAEAFGRMRPRPQSPPRWGGEMGYQAKAPPAIVSEIARDMPEAR